MIDEYDRLAELAQRNKDLLNDLRRYLQNTGLCSFERDASDVDLIAVYMYKPTGKGDALWRTPMTETETQQLDELLRAREKVSVAYHAWYDDPANLGDPDLGLDEADWRATRDIHLWVQQKIDKARCERYAATCPAPLDDQQ